MPCVVSACSEAIAPCGAQVGVPEFNPAGGAGMQSGAALLNAAARRQQALLAKLQGALPKLSSCKFMVELVRNSSHAVHLRALSGRAASTSEPALEAMRAIYPMFSVGTESVQQTLMDSVSALRSAVDKAAGAA